MFDLHPLSCHTWPLVKNPRSVGMSWRMWGSFPWLWSSWFWCLPRPSATCETKNVGTCKPQNFTIRTWIYIAHLVWYMLDAQLVSIYANCRQEDVVEECLSFATSPGLTCFQLLHQPLSAAQVHWITMWKGSMVWARGSQVCCTSDVDFGHLWSLIANVDPLGKINQMARNTKK